MKRNKLYTVNKWNKQLFMPEENLFLLGGTSQSQFFSHQGGGTYGNTPYPTLGNTSTGLNTDNVVSFMNNSPALNTSNYSLRPLESYLPQGLSEDTYRNLAIGSSGQMLNAFSNFGKSVVDNFGKGNLFKAASGPTINTKDPSAFFGKDLTLDSNKGSAGAGKSGLKGAAAQAAGAVALNLAGAIDTGERNGLFDTLDPVHHLAGGRESNVGNAMSDTGVALTKTGNPWLMLAGAGLKITGGLTNAAFGLKTDKKGLEAANNSISQNSNFVSNASTFDDIQGPASMTNTNIYEGGWFSGSKARRKNRELKEAMQNAYSWATRSIDNNVNNIFSDKISNFLRDYHAYGGPLDTGGGALGLMQQNRYFDTIDKRTDAIAGKAANTAQTAFTTGTKTFADGGLKAAFMDEFGKDPIGAAVRYNQGLEAMAAQEEMRKIEAAKEQEYADMQKRLLNLETENQGLQALMAAQPQTTLPMIPEIPETEETPASSSTPSKAASRVSSGNATWDYVEDQLRKSGKFNDIQIEGIKYNLQRESALNPDIVGDGGAAFGLGQWHGSRQPKDKSLEGQTKHLIDTLSNFDGKEHWIGKGNYEGFLNARTPEEAHYYIAKGYERPRADIVAKVKRDSDMSLRRLKAFGGELGTNGTDWTNGLLYIDEGGSHEENPFDGVPMGLDPEGVPNLVEEGETVYNNYVFSDRMNVPDFMLKDLGLPKSKKGISFADASKKLAQESEKRPNDPISQDGLEASLSRLAEIQETERMRKQGKEYMGLEGYACGGKMGRKYSGLGDKSQRLNIGVKTPSLNYTIPALPDFETLSLMSSLPASKKAKKFRSSNNPYGNEVDENEIDDFVPVTEEEAAALTRSAVEEPEAAWDYGDPQVMQQVSAGTYKEPEVEEVEVSEGYKPYKTWMRYAPAVGSGIMALTDALGITNKPDYTYADRIAASAERAGYAPTVRYRPIGNYLTYRPMDIWFEQNRMDANARATDRAIMNNAAPIGTKMAGLLASGYNSQIADGQLYRNALEYNDAKRERVADFNRKTNMFNSQMGLEASMANARYHQAAQQMGLSGLAQAAALRDSIDARTGAAKSANLTNFLTSLGNIGRENFALNQINSDRSRQYGVYRNGVSEHKRSSKGKKGSRWT